MDRFSLFIRGICLLKFWQWYIILAQAHTNDSNKTGCILKIHLKIMFLFFGEFLPRFQGLMMRE